MTGKVTALYEELYYFFFSIKCWSEQKQLCLVLLLGLGCVAMVTFYLKLTPLSQGPAGILMTSQVLFFCQDWGHAMGKGDREK